MQTWCIPPALFFFRNPAIGLSLPSGCSSSILVFPRLTKTTDTTCSGRGTGSPTSAPEHFYKMLWPFPSLALRLQHGWVDPGSIQGQPLDVRTATRKFLRLKLESEVWGKALKNWTAVDIPLLRTDVFLKLIFKNTCKNYLLILFREIKSEEINEKHTSELFILLWNNCLELKG